MTERPFSDHRQASLALLNGNYRLSRKAGQFLGQVAVDSTPMSEAQSDWLAKLLERAGLPPLAEGEAQSAFIPTHRGIGRWKLLSQLPMPWPAS